MKSAAAPVAALSTAAAGATALHLGPAVAGLRQARIALWPALAGVGRPGHVALTFDDGPDPLSTPLFLDALDRLGWKATFFMLGYQVRRSPGLAREVADRGHEIAAHGFEHRNHLIHSWRWVHDDLARATDVIAGTTGSPPRFWRPPYGALGTSSLLAARRQGVTTVLWTTWGKDWQRRATASSIVATVASTWHPAPTVLLHDSDITSAPESWRASLAALELLARRWEIERLAVGTFGEHQHQP